MAIPGGHAGELILRARDSTEGRRAQAIAKLAQPGRGNFRCSARFAPGALRKSTFQVLLKGRRKAMRTR